MADEQTTSQTTQDAQEAASAVKEGNDTPEQESHAQGAAEGAEKTFTQSELNKISYGNASIKGTYSPLLSSHADCYRRLGADPESDKEFIEKWFTEAAFYKTAGDV